ncbi:hypothetical protein [uncultured Adlercreutzia sp.]|uniref:hypothetical protein n=1 Tax=uncultured Adlercreutzia sp. TaxID=875803 RepID=UPI002674F7B4|nr:hypothetical protein [uncultured Adlercreutzia sp.]
MTQFLVLLLCFGFTMIFARALKSWPVPFYLVAAAVAGGAMCLTYSPAPDPLLRGFAFVVQKGYVGFAFLAIVMFIGVFDERGWVRQRLQPIRGELSLVSIVLMGAHVIPYALTYGGMVGKLHVLRPSIVVSLALAAVILVLFAVLAVTSVKRVKRSMRAVAWKRVQQLAYVFFVLVLVHLIGYLVVPAQAASPEALGSLAYYGVVYGAYAVARLARWRVDRRAGNCPASSRREEELSASSVDDASATCA